MIIERIKNKEYKINLKKNLNNYKVQQNKTKPFLNDSYNGTICSNKKNNIKGKLKSSLEFIKNKWKTIGTILGAFCLYSVIIGINKNIANKQKETKNKLKTIDESIRNSINLKEEKITEKPIKKTNYISFGSGFNIGKKENKYPSKNISQEQIQYLKNKFKNGYLSEQEFSILINDEYARLRSVGPYKKNYNNNFSDSIINIQREIDYPQNSYVKLLKRNSWTYRIYRNIPSNEIGQRISLNVKGDSKLIRELDTLMTNGQYRDKSGKIYSINPVDFYYKTFEDASMWGTREDPITMYFRGDINYQTLNAIGQIASKYARGSLNSANENVPFMMVEKSPTSYMVFDLINTAMKININLGNAILKNTSFAGNEYILSSGQYNAYKKVLEEYIQFLKYKKNN